MVGPGAQVGSKGGPGIPKLLQVEPTHTSSKQKMLPKIASILCLLEVYVGST